MLVSRHHAEVNAPRDVPAHLLADPFRCTDARALGVSVDTLRGPRFRAPFQGVRVAAALADSVQLRASAALLALPAGSVLSCHTAAELRRLPVPRQSAVHADIPAARVRTRMPGIQAHRRDVTAVQLSGLPVCTPGEMFLELATYLSLIDLVVVGDALVRRGWMRLDALEAAVGAANRRRGVGLARRAVALVQPRVDSPMETRVRLLVALAGLPCPVPGYRVLADGHVIGWVDLALPAYRIAIEYDGDLHRTLKRRWRMDVATRDELRDLGWTVLVLTWDDYAVTPLRTVGRVARELDRRGCPNVPPRWRDGIVEPWTLSAEWRAAFPGAGQQAWEWADAPPG